MTERWDQIKEIVASALEQSPRERSSFVRQACGHDDSLRAEVESLVSGYDRADSILELPPSPDVLFSQSPDMIGRQIGAYRILRETGHGGMAIVYLAERADQEFRKRVAIKMVKAGANNQEILARFRNERQTLASLDHPNIVKLLDGGSTGEGLPYLVMDYVEGDPITKHCDDHRLSIRERLRLFQNVCGAVEYAHQNRVIHRDLKPSNILVPSDGTPRLLDFGIAKLLNPECLQTDLVTRTDRRPMTPEYASPEQVRGEPVSDASDTYSLGILLYELLTGHRPYRVSHHSWAEIERLVCEADPESASSAAGRTEEVISYDGTTSLSVTPELVSEARGVRPDELRRCLQGDLDTIVLKALRKDRHDRYASVEALATDIECYLSGLPIEARRPTVFYRSGKFLRRHRESVVAAAIMVTLTAGFGMWEARRTWKQSVAEQHSASVHIRVRPSVAILGFKNLSGRSDTAWVSTAFSEILTAELAGGEQLRMVPGETVGRTKIDLGLSDMESIPPDSLAKVRKNLGSDFVVLGSYLDLGKENGGRIRLDLRLQDTAKGETIAVVSETGKETTIIDLASQVGVNLRDQLALRKLSRAESAAVTAELPTSPEAMRLYSQGLAKLRGFDALAAQELLSRAVVADPSFPLAHSALATAWSSLGYDSNAVQEAKKALDLVANLSREKHLLVQGRYYETSREWDKAIETYRTMFNFFSDNLDYGLYLASAQVSGDRGKDALATVEELRKLPGDAKDDPRIDLAEQEAAYSLSDNKRSLDAGEKVIRKVSSTGARLVRARALRYQCRVFADVGQAKESTAACEESRRIYEEAGDLAGVAKTLFGMADVPVNQGDYERGKTLYEEALSIARQIGDKKGQERILGNIGMIFDKEGDIATAEKTYGESIALSRQIGDKHATLINMSNLGDLLHYEGRLSDALAEFTGALTLARQIGHRSSEAIDINSIGNVLADRGDLVDAMQRDQQALSIQREIEERTYYAFTLMSIGDILRQKGEAQAAKKNYEEALSIRQQLGEKGTAAESQLGLGELACDVANATEGESLARAAAVEFRNEGQRSKEILAEALLSRSLLQHGKLDEAQSSIEKARQLSQQTRDVTVRMTLEIQLAYVRAATKDFASAEQAARNVLAKATKLGFVRFRFEASLALGEVQIRRGSPIAGHARLEKLEKEARAKGFELVARKAAATLRGERVN